MNQTIFETFIDKIAITCLYLYLNVVDILTVSCIFYYSKFTSINIPFSIILLTSLSIETFTFYYKCIQIEKYISNFIFYLSITWSILSSFIYILWICMYTDTELFNTIQLILLPILKCLSSLFNYYICRIRLLRNFQVTKDTIINLNETETYLIDNTI